jgi:hypothetical protein
LDHADELEIPDVGRDAYRYMVEHITRILSETQS